MSTSLPDGVRPMWLEGVVTSEYERDTLPLLFSPDEVFNEYYEVLAQKNPSFRRPLEMIHARNAKAREQRSSGYWQECLNVLSQCLHLRRCIFDDDDFQYVAAAHHYVLSILNFATFFLNQSRTASTPALREGILAKAFQLFKQAEEASKQTANPQHSSFLRAIVANNMANYLYRRRRMKAACQQTTIALKHWSRCRVGPGTAFFIARDATSLCFAGKWEEAAKALTLVKKAAEEEDFSGSQGDPELFAGAPVRFNIQLLANPMPISDATQLVLNHNIAVTLIALRRHKEATAWCQKAMEAATACSRHLAPTHPWIKSIAACQNFCNNASGNPLYNKFRMKADDCHMPEFRQMQRLIGETRTMPVFSNLLHHHRQRSLEKQAEKEAAEEEERQYRDNLTRQTAAAHQQPGTVSLYHGTNRDNPAGPPPAGVRSTRKRLPMASLRLYIKETTYKQFVDEYAAERRAARQARADSAKKRDLIQAQETDLQLRTIEKQRAEDNDDVSSSTSSGTD